MTSAKLWEMAAKCLFAIFLLGCGPSATKVSPADEARIKIEGKKSAAEGQRIQAEHIAKMLRNQSQTTKDIAAKKLAEGQKSDDD